MRRRLRIAVPLVTLCLAGSSGFAGEVLRPGDTLSGVALRHHVSVGALAAANHIRDPNRVLAGTVLQIPGPGSAPASGGGRPAAPPSGHYTVRSGDNLAKIAAQLRTTPAVLVSLNHLRHPNLLPIGTVLVVPTPPPAPGRPPLKALTPAQKRAVAASVTHWAHAYGVPVDFMKALTWWESGWHNDAVSSTGALGIGQLMPATASFVSHTLLRLPLDPRRPDDNVRMSAAFLGHLLAQVGGRPDLAAAAYYQGLAMTQKGRFYDDTKHYVAGVLSYRKLFVK